MKRIKKIKRRVAALVMSFFLTLGFITPAFNFTAKAEAVEVLNGASTIADIIVTYMAGSGAGITNTTVLGNLYNTVGSGFGTIADFVDDGLLVVDAFGNYIDNGLGNAINSVDWSQIGLNVNNLFSATSEQVAAGLATGTTAGANLAASAGGLAGGALIGTVAAATGAVAAGIGLGILINHIREELVKNINQGVPIDFNKDILNNAYPNGQVFYFKTESGETYIMCSQNNVCVKTRRSSPAGYYVNVAGMVNTYFKSKSSSNTKLYTTKLTSKTYSFGGFLDDGYISDNLILGNAETIADSIIAGTYEKPQNYSPDMIGRNGNQIATYNNGQYDTPDLLPQIDPTTEGLQPIPQQQWLEFANSANQNTSTSTTPQADNAQLFNNFLPNYIGTAPEPEPEPEPDPDPNPCPDPETVPVPGINPYPDTYPVADPESVPENKPQPEYTEKATENETDISEGDPYTTPNLLDKFPFCIPRDILRAFKKLDSGSREAPHIQWRFHPNEMIDYTFDVDFSTWDSVAVILRSLELIAFIILLGIATRNLILS